MTVRPATEADIPVFDALFARHADTSMFLRQALLAGISGGPSPLDARFWRVGDGAVALSTGGFLSMQIPDATEAQLAALRVALEGETLRGMSGEASQVERLLPALGLDETLLGVDGVEPLYRLELADLGTGHRGDLRRPEAGDLGWLTRWRQFYEAELHGHAPQAAIRRHVEALVSADRMRILWSGGVPVAVTAFNARLPAPAGMVQVGGVFTPRAFRSRNFARMAVALHLAEARDEGAQTAILFASGPPAMRAYEAIGFRQVGRYRLAMFQPPVVVSAG